MRLFRSLAIGSLSAAGMMVVLDQANSVSAADAKAVAKADLNNLTKAEKQALRQKLKEAGNNATTPPAKPAETAPPPAKPAVRKPPLTQDAAALARQIDARLNEKLAAAKITPSPRCTDEEFLRRAYLDITGVIPTAEKAKQFLDDPNPNKRAALVDQLLADPNYGRKQSDIWTPKLYARDSANRFVTREPFTQWIKEQFNKNTPWNQFVYSLVAATGTVDQHPEVTFFLANRAIDKLTDATTQHFMGVRLGCAQCHNHPFTDTKQTEYWGIAAFFSKVQPDKVQNANKGGDNSKLGVTEGPRESKQKDFFPESTKRVPAKFLGAEEPKLNPAEPYRPVLAKWLTSAENPFFSKAIVNRTWAAYFGNGIVDPIDDMIKTHPASHPELLDELADHFARTGFDLKYLVKAICLTDAYQRSARATGNNQSDHELLSHMNVKLMSAEELYDSLATVTGAAAKEDARKKKDAAGGKGNAGGPRAQFVNFFLAGNEESNPTEYEAGIPQALKLMNSNLSGNPQVVKQFGTGKPAEVLEKMYLTTLSRRPTADESKRLTDYVAKAGSATEAYSDILWALVNSSEFRMIK
jgi:hypothetical protein